MVYIKLTIKKYGMVEVEGMHLAPYIAQDLEHS
jgi:hypothetical protein